ncbi:hypothetical protein L3X38_032094 [Prunus dulcis]|uniref:Uncharacterized protein n=1 Tax=Prunus dulcis TaxID=3755 RepID=A0AAD4VF11_PRUDU|nr:hypothetical protein L3X38_032094 [Prunus dulcis]
MAAREGAILVVDGDFNNVIFENHWGWFYPYPSSCKWSGSSSGKLCFPSYASHLGTTTTWFEELPYLLVDVLYEECNL